MKQLVIVTKPIKINLDINFNELQIKYFKCSF